MGKNIGTVALAAAVGLIALLAPGSIDAGCPGSQILDATFQYLVSNPDWGASSSGGDGSCSTDYGCYASESDPPVSSGMRGVFWDVGTGNPAIGLGNDSGILSGGFGATDFWLKQVSADFAAGLYHYPAWLSLKLGPNNVVGPPVSWSFPDVDGCGPANPPEMTCTCFLLTDEWNGAGYFVTLSALSDQLGNTRYNPGEVIRLAAIPAPRITGSVRNASTGDVTLQVSHAPIAGGTYPADGCGTCLGGFRVFGQLLPRGAAAPTARSTGWLELPGAGGGAQPTTALNGTASVLADCDALVNQDLYLAIALVGEGATPFLTSHVSVNSTLVHCGATFADPERPGNRPADPRPGRGRDARDRTR